MIVDDNIPNVKALDVLQQTGDAWFSIFSAPNHHSNCWYTRAANAFIFEFSNYCATTIVSKPYPHCI